MDIALVAAGLAILLVAGDLLVRGAVNLALRLGIPALVVSLTVVAFGTSAPELLISVDAVLKGVPGLALGNVVGSNIANVLLVLGLPALISGLSMAAVDTRRSYVVMLLATALGIGACLLGPLTWVHGAVLLIGLFATLGDQLRGALASRKTLGTEVLEVEGAAPDMPWWRILLYLGLGLAGLPLGADILIEGATALAQAFGISDAVIGLTLVAIGTSLPELATTVVAAMRRQADVALGNVVGSNIFNLLGIVGIASLVNTIPVDPSFLRVDLWVMLAAALVLAPFVFLRWAMTRLWGVAFLTVYAVYLGSLVT